MIYKQVKVEEKYLQRSRQGSFSVCFFSPSISMNQIKLTLALLNLEEVIQSGVNRAVAFR